MGDFALKSPQCRPRVIFKESSLKMTRRSRLPKTTDMQWCRVQNTAKNWNSYHHSCCFYCLSTFFFISNNHSNDSKEGSNRRTIYGWCRGILIVLLPSGRHQTLIGVVIHSWIGGTQTWQGGSPPVPFVDVYPSSSRHHDVSLSWSQSAVILCFLWDTTHSHLPIINPT